MTYEEFNHYCGRRAAATYVNQWGGAHVWKVDGKVFAIGGWENECGAAFIFKTSPHNFDLLKEQPGFRGAPYFASRGMKWIQLYDTSKEKPDRLLYYLSESYRLVSLGLTKKRQKELGLNQA